MHFAIDGRIILINGDAVARVLVGTFAEDHTAVGVLSIDLHPLPCSSIVAARETERCTDLKEVDPGECFLEPVFLRHCPTSTHRGEVAPHVLGCELRRSISTKQELEQVLISIGVVDTSDIGE